MFKFQVVLALFLVIGMQSVKAEVVNNIDLAEVERELAGEGVVGHVHGAVPQYGHFVFTYRDKNNFFNHLEFSMIPVTASARETLMTLRRHDKVRLFGRFSADNPSAFKHIKIKKLEVIKKYESDERTPPYNHELKLPEELKDKESFIGKVHAHTYDGKVLVVEYKDTVLPLFVEDPSRLAQFFRNDTVKVFFKIIPPQGRRPMHLFLDQARQVPIEVLEAIEPGHGEPVTLTGDLVMFPESPQILFNIFAVRVIDRFGVLHNYTLVNFDDSEFFKKLREKLQSVWDANLASARGDRNMWLNPKVRVIASGIKNVVSPVQANPQILVSELDAVKFEILE